MNYKKVMGRKRDLAFKGLASLSFGAVAGAIIMGIGEALDAPQFLSTCASLYFGGAAAVATAFLLRETIPQELEDSGEDHQMYIEHRPSAEIIPFKPR